MNQLFGEHIKTLCKRFDSVLKTEGVDSVVIPSGELKLQFLDDMDYPFKVNPQFKTWVPITNNPHCWVVYRAATKPLLVFYQAEDFWHKPVILKEDYWTGYFDIKIIHQPHQAYQYLPDNGPDCALLGEWSPFYQGRLEQLLQNPETLLNRLHFARTIKTEYEIECMKIANQIAVGGHLAAEQAFKSGESELAIHLAYLKASNQLEQELPYGNIVALNSNGAVLHYQHCETDTKATRHSFLIDAGATCHGYNSDITRTYAAKDGEFADMLAAFEEIQLKLVAGLKPGVDYLQMHHQTHQMIAAWMADFGLLNSSAESAMEAGVTQTFLPHGLGHFIGLQVHDVAGKQADAEGSLKEQPENYPFLRLLHKLEAGHVVTIEPGVYFIPSLMATLKQSEHGHLVNWTKVESMVPYGGIRIEDDVVITASGHINLTRNAFENA
jgi:Xaa-Pro dipeptidase